MGYWWHCYSCEVETQKPDPDDLVCIVCMAEGDGYGWAQEDPWDDWKANQDPVDLDPIEEAAEEAKKERGQKHKPVDGCPEDCPIEHQFDSFRLVQLSEAKEEADLLLGAFIDPPINATHPKGTLTWKITVGADLIELEGGLSERTTHAADIYQSLFVLSDVLTEDQEAVEVKVQCTFNFGGKADSDHVRTIKILIGELRREPGEVAASRTSEFELVEYPGWVIPEYGDAAGEATAWLLHDFEVGKADLAGPGKEASFLACLRWLHEHRLRKPVYLDGREVMRRVHVRGYADRIDRIGVNAELRPDRAQLTRDALAKLGEPGLLVSRGDLEPHERQVVDLPGDYPSSNTTREGRAMNRGVLLFEVLHQGSKEDQRRKRLRRHFDSSPRIEVMLDELRGTPGWGCLLDRLAAIYGVPHAARQVEDVIKTFLTESGAPTWASFRRAWDRQADLDDVYFRPDHIDTIVNLPYAAGDAPSGAELLRVLRRHATTLSTALVDCLAATPIAEEGEATHARFLMLAKTLIHPATSRTSYEFERAGCGVFEGALYSGCMNLTNAKAGADVISGHPGWTALLEFIQRKSEGGRSVYSCFADAIALWETGPADRLPL